ncbi:hypothetical protein D8T26_01025 [Vibrio vulnificus]|uniref:BatD family protein n=1 Tax=Vibrio vulnificus TaxID=672 RepID=UPI000F4D3750|nr:BatD family protein [Vibrio vulnificus]MCA3985017.1 BatD family protein [Vibrio vulnificus]RPB31074.1 hypothetical protein CYV18_16990 [Vibrio vulnificus]RZQ91202.1 hypothetical protein D8T26_01025 [Vibrio vulnificus]HDY7817325.1 BatD family protein [Vibrio vulnificus]
MMMYAKFATPFPHKWLMAMFLTLSSLVLSATTCAQDIEDLQRSNHVELLAWVGQPPKAQETKTLPVFSVNEQVILTIEVATPRWFTAGTRIGHVEIPNVIAKQRNPLATNYTERKGGHTWSRQRWEITLYPQASGRFVVPPIAVSVQVSAPNGENVSGTLYTAPISFDASMPSGLIQPQSAWFSASDVEVDQQWQTSSEPLKVGDAITRTITIRAKDSLSVLLPKLLSNESTSRYQAYPQPNRLEDTQIRGDYRSSRTEETVYVIQQGGDLSLPERQFQWWNSDSQTLETVVIEGNTFHAKHTFQSFIRAYSKWLVAGGLFLFSFMAVIVMVKRHYRSRPLPTWLVFRRLLKAKRWPAVRALLYKQLRVNDGELQIAKAHNSTPWQQSTAQFHQGVEDVSLMKQLWQGVQAKSRGYRRISLPKALPNLHRQQQAKNNQVKKNGQKS